MIPNPPIWIRPRITPCPKPDQYTGVSTTTNPVRLTAEVDVNSACRNPVSLPGTVAAGSVSTPAPIAMASANPVAMTRTGVGLKIADHRDAW